MEMETDLYGDCTLEEIKQGYIEENDGFTCLLCGEHFTKGEIYPFSGRLYEASKAVMIHIEQQHYSVKQFLLDMRAHHMGISDLQLQLINYFDRGISDKEIADYLGVSGSTIRNHRYKLRERERQNKIFLALMELIEEEENGKVVRKHIADKNEMRVMNISERERRKILERYLTPRGKLKAYPSYEKSKRIILEAVLERFCTGKQYSEQEINDSLSLIYKDYRLLKQELIDYDYLGRSNKGGIYWFKDQKKEA